jgi:CTP synthase
MLREIGIQPNILFCRADRPLAPELKAKIALFCNVTPDAVVTGRDVETIYEVPLALHEEGIDEKITRLLNIWTRRPDLAVWEEIVRRIYQPKAEVEIALVGKYIQLKESYKSLTEAFVHGGVANETRVNLRWIDAETVEKEGAERHLDGVDGLMVPGGFGMRGIEGKVAAIRFARERALPFFSICLGMQCAAIEFGRHVLGLAGANSSEFDPRTPHPVIDLLPEQHGIADKGGTMRLGSYPCTLEEGSLAFQAYGQAEIQERHRHRYEFNNAYREKYAAAGMRLSGIYPGRTLVEIIELPSHPWFLGCQFHPEFKSRPWAAHPLFREFGRAARGHRERTAPVAGHVVETTRA